MPGPKIKDQRFVEEVTISFRRGECAESLRPVEEFEQSEGMYYNIFYPGNQIAMPNPIMDDIVEYDDGTEATHSQISKDVTTFLSWAAEPELEERHRTGVKVIIYLILLTVLVYLSMKKIWSRIDSEV